MRILILGAGKMGRWLSDSLCLEEEIAVFDSDKTKLKYLFDVQRLTSLEEIYDFQPEMVINAVGLAQTEKAFSQVLPYIPKNCILSDIASVKNNIETFYRNSGFLFVSSHPMFGPTFANVRQLQTQSAIIMEESCPQGRQFFKGFYEKLGIHVIEVSFKEHDQLTAYSLATPFMATLAFASCLKPIEAPGTTFKKHVEIADGLLSEDNELLSEILLNQYSLQQMKSIHKVLNQLSSWIETKNTEALNQFINNLKKEWETYKNALC